VRYKLAILNVLANQPGGRATRDAVRREAGLVIASLDQIELQRFTALGDIDIFRSGWVLRDDTGLEITDTGLALLDWLQGVPGSTLELASSAAPPAFGMTDDFIPSEQPSGPFNPEVGMPVNVDPRRVLDEHRTVAAGMKFSESQIHSHDLHRTRDFAVVQRAQDMLRSLSSFIATKRRLFLNPRRRSAPKNPRTAKPTNERSIRTLAGAAFAVLALLFVIACILAAIAFGQIQSLKSDMAVLRRELLPVKERFAKFEEAENQRRDQDQQQEAQKRSETGKDQSAAEVRSDAMSLNLTREEIQLVREYIKPTPSPASAAPEINVGDAVGGAMIPLPSALTDKVSKLVGARFITRNGAIILFKKDSRQADAVLGPN
jgi:hypothetical protein